MTVTAYIALGSNLGDRRAYLERAVEALRGLGGVTVTRLSSLYETAPVGGPPGQGPYLNIVVAIESDAPARQLLGMCHRMESAAGRVRAERWGPRPLDVDILWIDGEVIDEPDLQVPHPRMTQRRFVMVPLLDIAPDVAPSAWEDRAEGWVRPVEAL